MNKPNRAKLAERVTRAADTVLASQHYVSAVDILRGIGWLDPSHEKRWRQGQERYLEAVISTNLSRISEAISLFRAWAAAKGLKPSETDYVARSAGRRPLQFSKSGNPNIERHYRTHFVSPELSEKQQARLAEKASKPPDLAVIAPLKQDWRCHVCGESGDLLMVQDDHPTCLRCVGLGDLAFLPAGDARLTRTARKLSERSAVVVRWSRARDRYERLGLLLEPAAIAAAEAEVESVRD